MKNIRNNWITESHKELVIRSPGSERKILGVWKDVVELHESERDNFVKMTSLSHSACFPSSIQRQNLLWF